MTTDVHTEHCCAEHGCCYGDADCTVKTGVLVQSFPCEMCSWAEKEISFWLGEATEDQLLAELRRRGLDITATYGA